MNNWVQIVNRYRKTGRMPQFNELGFCRIFDENKREISMFPLHLHIIMKIHVFHVLYNLQNLYNRPGNHISGT